MAHSFHHRGPMRFSKIPSAHEFRTKADVWNFVGEHVSAVEPECYSWDEKLVEAIRMYEPDFCPLWVVSVYKSPAGSEYKFGRHAIGIDTQNHIQEGSHQPLRVHSATYGVNKGRRPIVISDILQDKTVSLIPDLKVYGYRPFDWDVYYAAKRDVWERRHVADEDSEQEIESMRVAQAEAAQLETAKADAEADYRWDHATNRGKQLREAAQAMTHADWRALGVK
jgi:hypothetical protein